MKTKTCPNCNGSKFTHEFGATWECYLCEGEGTIPDESDHENDDYGHESDYEECPACLNKDAVVEKCFVCKGSGYVSA